MPASLGFRVYALAFTPNSQRLSAIFEAENEYEEPLFGLWIDLCVWFGIFSFFATGEKGTKIATKTAFMSLKMVKSA
jgi:hypothetical protein